MPLLLLLALVVLIPEAAADEGMWMPQQLPELARQLEDAGLELKAASLADLTSYPLGAVIWLGGCTASFVSENGLVVTNHHCAYGSIQHNSTEENNILKHGFLAHSLAEELPAAPGTRVLVTLDVRDVTEEILRAVPKGARGNERYDAIEAAEKALVAECEAADGVRCRVRSFYGGLTYQLITQFELRDVRLVYAPALAVGKFGGDVDNWMWPRHTGDFAFLRAYVGPDGKPADPDPSNVPFRPHHWLEVSRDGLQDGDFVMVAGYPGRTNRYRLADEVEHQIDVYYPLAVEATTNVIAAIDRALLSYPDAKLKLAPALSSLNNVAKKYRGMMAGFARTDVVAEKRRLESDLADWIASDARRRSRYGSALEDLRDVVSEDQANTARDLYWHMARRWAPLSAATRLYRLARESEKPDRDRKPGFQERDLDRFRHRLKRMDRTYHAGVDRLVARERMRMYATLPAEKRVPAFDAFLELDSDRLEDRLGAMIADTEMTKSERRLAWMEELPEAFEASDDPFIRLAVTLYPTDLAREEETERISGRFEEARPRFMEALIAYQKSRGCPVYPDANSTLRVTTGHVAGYEPRDGVWYAPFTTVEGILEKDTGIEPFDSPPEVLEAIRTGDYGPYAPRNLGSVPVDFLSTLDTTGGNSGSPTLNGRGELVGLLFDGAWESLLADWYYEPDRKRSIHTDMRYVLWVMDRIDGAHHLLSEMGIQPRFAAP